MTSEQHPLSQAMDSGIQRMLAHRRNKSGAERSNVVYTGQWHDSIPRRLILDPMLKPVEKLVWQIIRTHIGQPGEEGAWPSIRRLARLANVSRPTVQNAIDVLQAGRWLHVIRRVRDEQGAVIGNCYLLHASPLPIAETMLIAPDYLFELRKMAAMDGPSKKRVKAFAINALANLNIDAQKQMQSSQAFLRQMRENLNDNQDEEGVPDSDAAQLLDAADQVDRPTISHDDMLDLNWPSSLKASDKPRAMRILKEAPEGMAQPILDALEAARDVQKPLSYLARLVERARHGLFVPIGDDRTSHQDLREALERAEAALGSGMKVTVRGRPVEYMKGPAIRMEGDSGMIHAYSFKLKPEDIQTFPP